MGSGRKSGSRKSQVNPEGLKRILALGKKKSLPTNTQLAAFPMMF